MKGKLTPLNPLFADIPTWEFITRVESLCVFKSAALESELNARLERRGEQWRFVGVARIQIFLSD